ncbi:MAG: saccharopine dehydrogenase C-terminal domain-containing protein [Acidobacteriota bacterium]
MKKILILGAGFVSRPGVTYLLENKNFEIIVADMDINRAKNLVEGFDNGNAVELNVNDTEKLESLIKENDIIVSLLPWVFHIRVAELCLQNGKNMATTSYVGEGMKKLDAEVKEKGLLFLNEMGVDPGIDHMTAKKIIDNVKKNGGRIVHFYSYCGGLPAPEDNDNPFGYKFSWSPKGVVLASKNSARFLENGDLVDIDGKNLFLNSREEFVEGLGKFEVYPNRDSIPYLELYGLNDSETVMRGTYRYPGWCETLKKIVDLGLVDETPVKGLKGLTYHKMMAKIIGSDNAENIKEKTAGKIGLDQNHQVIEKLEWLGLFGDEIVPDADNYLDILSILLKKKLYYKENEKDMLLLKHKFIVENRDGSKDQITSTLVDFGIPGGDTAMARTVSLPLAIGVKLMAEGKFDLKGVRIPVVPEIYDPVLEELEKLNIKMVEKKESLN